MALSEKYVLWCLALLTAIAPVKAGWGQAPPIHIRNNHELAYEGPVRFEAEAPDGVYRGDGATITVRSGQASGTVALPPQARTVAFWSGDGPGVGEGGAFAATPDGSALRLIWDGTDVGRLDLGLVVLPGTQAGPEEATAAYEPADIAWDVAEGEYRGRFGARGYDVTITIRAHAGGWLDVYADLVRTEGATEKEYLALVRRLTGSAIDEPAMRWNGKVLEGAASPTTWERDFWYTRGLDWIAWRSGDLRFAVANGYTPAPTIERDSAWVEGSHFYVWERSRPVENGIQLISEISGPNPEQAKSGYMPVTPYAPVPQGDRVALKWRLALAENTTPGWADSHLRAFAGHRSVRHSDAGVTVDLGVPAASFGTSYFPYSTLAENFDYYRTPGLNQETWWPFSPALWSQWRTFIPRMETDLHIIRAMGFEWVRLHHLEVLQLMDRKEALAFLDYFAEACRRRGLKLIVDTEGPSDWVAEVAGRYPDVVERIELENEILIQGINPGDAERWTELYRAAKKAAPQTQVFLTGAGNDGMFERARDLGIPFDRVGLHAYKHGPEWKEAFYAHALGTAGYASDRGLPVTLGEFNWKNLTRLSPTERREEFAASYEPMLAPRAIPEFFQFHWQETLCVNPSISRGGIRHYETIMLDRRPKPEAFELMRMIRSYGAPHAPVRALPVQIEEAVFEEGAATARFTVVNATERSQTVRLTPRAFGLIRSELAGPADAVLQPGDTLSGHVALRLEPDEEVTAVGTYHHFLEVSYGGGTAYGWGIAANPGAPTFEPEAVLAEFVTYPQGEDVVERFDYAGPLAVAYGPEASKLELEMAYMLANTLQSATGRSVWLSDTQDLPASYRQDGSVLLVGRPDTNPDIPEAALAGAAGRGVVRLEGTDRLLFTGATEEGVQAAATDVMLRFWQYAKDAVIRVTGMVPGAALGNKAGVTNPDPP